MEAVGSNKRKALNKAALKFGLGRLGKYRHLFTSIVR
jgi:hypothetical protein